MPRIEPSNGRSIKLIMFVLLPFLLLMLFSTTFETSSGDNLGHETHEYYAGFVAVPRLVSSIVAVICEVGILAGASMAIVLFARNRKRSSRIQKGLCFSCGYDLRATLARCPECGTTPPQPSKHLSTWKP